MEFRRQNQEAIFRQNGRYDINASAKQVISAFGNQLANRTSGDVDLKN